MTNEQKLEAVKTWLTENNIEFKENHTTRVGLKIDLFVPSLLISIHVGENGADDFYKRTFKWCKPFFIRDSETKAFILEKLQNCCFDQMVRMQKKFEKENKEK